MSISLWRSLSVIQPFITTFSAPEDVEEAGEFADRAKLVSNLTWHGAYSSVAALPMGVSGALLYTSLWDGLPDVLLAAGAAGIPIVASDVGGISELIDNSTGWLVSEIHNPSAYIAALNMIAIDPGEARRRSQALRSRIRFRHSWEKYIEAICKSPSFLD